MAGLSWYEKAILGSTAVFVLVTGGWFLNRQNSTQHYTVSILAQQEAVQPEAPEEAGWPDSLLEGERIDLNRADVYDLGRLPGIGGKRAQAIVDEREQHGSFHYPEDLTAVKGIGPSKLEGFREMLDMSEGE